MTFFSPHETTRTIYSDSWSETQSSGSGAGASASRTWQINDDLWGVITEEELASRNQGANSFSSEGQAETTGGTSTTVPFYEFEREQEVASIQHYTLEELTHRAIAQMKTMSRRGIAVKLLGARVRLDETPEVVPAVPSPEQLQSYKESIYMTQPYYATMAEIEAEEALRLEKLSQNGPTHHDIDITPVKEDSDDGDDIFFVKT